MAQAPPLSMQELLLPVLLFQRPHVCWGRAEQSRGTRPGAVSPCCRLCCQQHKSRKRRDAALHRVRCPACLASPPRPAHSAQPLACLDFVKHVKLKAKLAPGPLPLLLRGARRLPAKLQKVWGMQAAARGCYRAAITAPAAPGCCPAGGMHLTALLLAAGRALPAGAAIPACWPACAPGCTGKQRC